VPALLLPIITQDISTREEAIARELERVSSRVAFFETEAMAKDTEVVRLENATSAVVSSNEAATVEDEAILEAVAIQLQSAEEELTALMARYEQLVDSLANRQTAADAAVVDAKRAVDAVGEGIEQAWAPRLYRSEQAMIVAREALENAVNGNAGLQDGSKDERDRFLAELARNRIARRVDFHLDYINQICLNFQNASSYFATISVGNLLFQDQLFSQLALLDNISDGGYLLNGFKSGRIFEFENRYSESVSGLEPGQVVEECSYMNDPEANELGRYFDSIGGFSEHGWDVEFDVQFGSFENTDKSITVVPLEVVFEANLKIAQAEAIAAYREARRETAAARGGVQEALAQTSDAELVSTEIKQAGIEIATPRAETAGASTGSEASTNSVAATDEVLSPNRDLAREVQAELNAAGFAVGQPDGLIGPRSQRAIADWQASNGYEPTGALTRSEAAELLVQREDTE
jgi:hypothetical protein